MKNNFSRTGIFGTVLLLMMPSIVALTLMAIFPFPAALAAGAAMGLCLAIGDVIGINGIALCVALWSLLSLSISLALYRRLRETPLRPLSIEVSR